MILWSWFVHVSLKFKAQISQTGPSHFTSHQVSSEQKNSMPAKGLHPCYAAGWAEMDQNSGCRNQQSLGTDHQIGAWAWLSHDENQVASFTVHCPYGRKNREYSKLLGLVTWAILEAKSIDCMERWRATLSKVQSFVKHSRQSDPDRAYRVPPCSTYFTPPSWRWFHVFCPNATTQLAPTNQKKPFSEIKMTFHNPPCAEKRMRSSTTKRKVKT